MKCLMLSKRQIDRIVKIINEYNGENPVILNMKRQYEIGKFEFTDFNVRYLNENKDYKTKEVNKIVNITTECSKVLIDKFKIVDFIPTKIWIGKIIGEMGGTYHCFVQFRKSIRPQLMFIKKNYIITPLFYKIDTKYENLDVAKYDKLTENIGRKLREHQIEAVKFLLRNKKCILADQQGLGKTTSAIIAALEGGFKKILVITTASLKTTWKNEIGLYVNEDEISIINGSKWKIPKKFNIINHDIMQNFYSVPYDEVETANENGEIVIKKRRSNKKTVIKENLDKSPLFNERFDCIIIDEAHKLSNKGSIRYSVISDLLNRSKPESVFLLTGTPLTNRPINLYTVLKLIDADVTKDYNYYVKRFCDARKITTKAGKSFYITNGASNLDELKEKIKHLYLRRLQSDIPGMVKKTIITREYDLNDKQKEEYDKIWNDYLEAQEEKGNIDAVKYKDLVEGILVRQFLAQEMIPNTVELADSHIDYGEKVIIICTFQEELDKLKGHYKDKAVIYNGKMKAKQKDEAIDRFLNDNKTMVMIANIVAVSVGLSLISSHFLIFNSYSWESALNLQAMDRIYRLTQTEDVTCVYQLFTDSISKDMFSKVMLKEYIMNETIKSEKEK